MRRLFVALAIVCVPIFYGPASAADESSAPASPVKLIFIHHSCGENWLADENGGLGLALRDNNYFVSDTNYDWGPDGVGSNTDIGHWYDWFVGENSAAFLSALYKESDRFGEYYSRMATDPRGENEIVMFKSCYPNSSLGGPPGAPAAEGKNPLRGQDAWSEHMTVANAKGIYNDLLEYFATRQDKLFIAITAPPQVEGETDASRAANARAFNDWLVEDWLDEYPYKNVAVFDFFNVLTSNGGNAEVNDAGKSGGNHHRWRGNRIEHVQMESNDMAAYASSPEDSHPTRAGNQKATQEFVPLLNVFYRRWAGEGNQSVHRVYFPHVASNKNWETEICVIRTAGEDVLSGQFKCFNQSGQMLGQPTKLDLGPRARAQRIVGSDFPDPANTKYIVFESNSENVVGYVKFFIEGKYRAAIPAVSEVNTGDLYVSHIASDDKWGTGLALVNTNAAETTVSIEFDNGQSFDRTLASGAYDCFSVQDLFGGLRQPNIGSAVVKNASGIVGLELFANDSANLLSGMLLKDDTASKVYFPHIASTSGWNTGIVAYNASDGQCNLEVTAYDDTGKALGVSNVLVEAKGRYFGLASALNLPADTHWMEIEADQPITGFELFSRPNQLAGYTVVDIAATSGVFPKIEKDGATGIAFVNTEDVKASVSLFCYDDQGGLIAQSVLELGSREKKVDFPENFFESDIAEGTYVRFESNRRIVGFQLNVSSDGMMLDALPGLRSDASMTGS